MKSRYSAYPYVIWMVIFTVVPLLLVAAFAITDSSGAYTLEKGTGGPTIAYTVKNGDADIPANREFAAFKANNTPQTGTVTLNAPEDSANAGQYQGNLVFSAALVPPDKTTP